MQCSCMPRSVFLNEKTVKKTLLAIVDICPEQSDSEVWKTLESKMYRSAVHNTTEKEPLASTIGKIMDSSGIKNEILFYL